MAKMLLYYAVLFGLVLILCVTSAVFFPRAQFTSSTCSPAQTTETGEHAKTENEIAASSSADTAANSIFGADSENIQSNALAEAAEDHIFDFVVSPSDLSSSGNDTLQTQQTESCDQQQSVTVYLSEEDTVVTMPESELVAQVLMGEVTAAFPNEALRAIAVAVRTYLVRRADTASTAHPTAQICDDCTHCMAMCSFSEACEKWGETAADSFYTRALQAAEDTQGEILTYQGKPIDAVFHAMSYGYTADASRVWGNTVPYLVSVETPETRDMANMIQTAVISADTFTKTFGTGTPSASYDAYGRLDTLNVGSRTFSCSDVRTALDLASTAISWQKNDDGSYTFTTYGSGHGVGLSQRGAELYAKDGKSYTWILSHYYPGTTLTVLSSPIV